MNTYDIAFEINSELFGGDEYVDEEDVIKVQKILEQRLKSTRIRELEEVLGDVVRAYTETGEVASAIRGCEQALNKTKKEANK